MNKIEQWKSEKHGLDVLADINRYASESTPMKSIDNADLERMKWHGVFYRKRDTPGSYMLRIRLPGCELSSRQAKEIAYIAYELGYGIVDITTRASLQIQGLTIDDVPNAMARLEACGLTTRQTGHDNVRNVFGHPLAGVDPDELIDTRSLCREITELFVDSRVYSDLPRKFNIAVNGRARHGSHYWSQDLSFLACDTPDQGVMFQVLIGGTQGQNPRLATHLPVLVAPEEVVDVSRAMLDLFRAQGTREKRGQARFRYLVERIGVGGVLEYLDESLIFPLRPYHSEPQPPSGYDELVGWFRQNDRNLWSMGLCVPVGRMSWQQLEGLARLGKKWGDGSLRVTHEQDILVTGIRSGSKDTAATQAAALGLSVHADSLARNTVACTGKQFCNIAVTETKGQMLKLVDRLRQRALMLHGIRIHMSGCPSSCAQHFTADIGLKGVRVRRILGTREGFDVYLGGGVAGQVHLGIPYRLGVDADQLPQLIEEVIQEYYQTHHAGQTFSSYWRDKLVKAEAAKVGDGEYTPPTWVCEGCDYHHLSQDPPVYCPSCAGLRRLFARIEDSYEDEADPTAARGAPPARTDGFVFAAKDEQLSSDEGLTVELAGNEYALFRMDGKVVAMDNACPHEGAPLAQGSIEDGTVTCPWHGWTFNACTGCSIEPAGNDVKNYETTVEDGNIYIKVGAAGPLTDDAARSGDTTPKPTRLPKAVTGELRVIGVIKETPDTKTFRLSNENEANENEANENRANENSVMPAHLCGQFANVAIQSADQEVWRSFTISSSPTATEHLDLTIKLNPEGFVSRTLHDHVKPGDTIKIKGPQGGFFFDPVRHIEPLVLISAGSGITPMMSILRHLAATDSDQSCTFIHGARSERDIIFSSECEELAGRMKNVQYHVHLTKPSSEWRGPTGRVDFSSVTEAVDAVVDARYFLCGPGEFMDSLKTALLEAGVAKDRIHTEQFQSGPTPLVTA